jgi:hypothetical protein
VSGPNANQGQAYERASYAERGHAGEREDPPTPRIAKLLHQLAHVIRTGA